MGKHLDLDDLVYGNPVAKAELLELRVAHERYEKIRKMKPIEFYVLWIKALRGEGRFDYLVDNYNK